jgi:transposase
VEETLVSGASVSIVARRHDINGNQLFTWRQQYRRGELGAVMNTLVPVGTIGADGIIHPEVQRETEAVAKASLSATTTPAVPSRIEIELPGGIKVRVDGDAQAPVLGRVMKLVRGLAC